MRCVEGLENLPPPAPSVVTVGKFFSVHLGHQALIRETVAAARQHGVRSVVLTFDRHPQALLRPGAALPVVASLAERRALIADLGVDLTAVVRLDLAFLAILPEQFARDVLRDRL